MRFRKLRIAWSVACVIACALLTTMWARSYQIRDIWWCCFARISTVQGRISISNRTPYPHFFIMHDSSKVLGKSTAGYPDDAGKYPNNRWVRVFRWKSGLTELHIPLWLPVLLSVSLGALPWIRQKWRFSLRAMLIAMALIAALLAFAVHYSTILFPPRPPTGARFG
jgi:hypothetical protein